jgi:dethiobiotin synthase
VSLPRLLFITGTDTGVGKTVVTAALAAALAVAGRSVAVYKPTQAGLEAGAGDIDVIRRLSGVSSVHEGIRLRHPMAPVAAAAREGLPLPSLTEHRLTIDQLCESHDATLVEGAGGLLVQLDSQGRTLADLAVNTAEADIEGGVLVVCRAALGTLNHTALTLEALRRRASQLTGVVIGSWPADPDEIEQSNRAELALMATVLGAIPAGAGTMAPATFQAGAYGWMGALCL